LNKRVGDRRLQQVNKRQQLIPNTVSPNSPTSESILHQRT